MAKTTFKNDVDIYSHNGSSAGLKLGNVLVTATAAEINNVCDNSARVVNVTASTLTVTLADHDKKVVTLNRAAGIAVTLPAASGSGAEYKFIIGTAVTSNSTTIKVANSSDVMTGHAIIESDNASDACIAFKVGASDDTITMDGSTKGGLKGDMIIIRDIAANLFHVQMIASATDSEATPFSATV